MYSITLQTNDQSVSSGEIIGRLQFAASSESDGGASQSIVGGLYGVAQSNFSSAANPNSLYFITSDNDSGPAFPRLEISYQGDFLPISGSYNQYDIGASHNRFDNIYSSGIDTYSVLLSSYVPSNTTNKLYNDNGTLKFNGSSIGGAGGGGLNDLIDDTSPQLGANLDINTYSITGVGNINIDGNITAEYFYGDLDGVVITECRNDTGSTIAEGTPVYVAGYYSSNGKPLIAPADCANAAKMPAIGLLASELTTGSEGHVHVFGLAQNLPSAVTNGFSVGNTVYVDNGGGLTNVRPTGVSELVQNIGRVLKTGTNGRILVLGPGRSNDVPNSGHFEQLTVDGYTALAVDGGNVGIGTASPSHKLDVSGVGRFVHADGDCGLMVEDTGGSGVHIGDCAFYGDTYAGIKHSSHTGSEYMLISRGDHTFISAAQGFASIIRGGLNSTSSEIRVNDTVDGGAGVIINNQYADRDVRIHGTGDPYVFYVDASADSVGIGTPSPSSKLHVSANTEYGLNVVQSGVTNSNVGLFQFTGGNVGSTSAGSALLRVSSNSNLRPLASFDDTTVITAGGNVGIGTSSSVTDKLDVYTTAVHGGITVRGTNAPALNIWDMSLAGGGSKITENSSALYSGVLIIDADTNDVGAGSYIDLRVDGDTKMVIDHNGYVGINTTTPLSRRFNVTDGSGQGYFAGGVWYAAHTGNGDCGFALVRAGSAKWSLQNDYSEGDNFHIRSGGFGGSSRFKMTSSETVLNEDGNSVNFRVEGSGDPNLLFTNASTDRVGIGTATPSQKLHVFDDSVNNAQIIVDDGTVQVKLQAYSAINSGGYVGTITDNDFILRTNNQDRIAIKNNSTYGGRVVVNPLKYNQDFQVKSETDDNILYVDANNDKVGIGTASPSSKLTVYDDNGFSSFRVESASSYAYSTIIHKSSTQWGYLEFINDAAHRAYVQQNGSNNNNYGGPNSLNIYSYAGPIVFGTNPTLGFVERMRITSSGNVGIGTASPATKLHIKSDTNSAYGNLFIEDTTSMAAGVGGSIVFGGAYTTAGATARYGIISAIKENSTSSDSKSAMVFYTNDAVGTTVEERMRITSSGNVGIGTASPNYKLHIKDDNATSTAIGTNILARLQSNAANADGGLQFSDGVTHASVIGQQFGGLYFVTGGEERLRVSNAGNVGIGTPSPSEKLDVDGTIRTRTGGIGHEDDGCYIAYPGGGTHRTTGNTTGYLKITLPVSWTNTMLAFDIDIYEYASQKIKKLRVGGYNYTASSQWLNTSAMMDSDNDFAKYKVHFGHDGTNCAIYISEIGTDNIDQGSSTVWSYPHISISNFFGGWSNFTMANWADGWDVGLTTTLGTITRSAEVSRPYRQHDTGYVFNEYGGAYNFRIEGDADQNLLFVQGADGHDNVAIGTNTPLDTAKFQIQNQGSTAKIYSQIIGGNNKGHGLLNNQSVIETLSQANSFYSYMFPSTNGNVTSMYHFRADPPTGVAGTVSNQAAFYAGAGLAEGNSNYGFMGQVPSGTNNYNIYMASSAKNYFNGDVGIGALSPSEKLDIRYPAGGGMALIKDSDSNDGLLFGDMAYSVSNAYQGIKHVGMTGSSDYMMMSEGTNTLISARSNGSVYIRGGGNFATNEIRIYPDTGGVVVNENGANSDFRVEGDTDQNLLRIDASAENIGIGTSSPTEKLTLDGSLKLGTKKPDDQPVSQSAGELIILSDTNAKRAIACNGDGRKIAATFVYSSGGQKIKISEDGGKTWSEKHTGSTSESFEQKGSMSVDGRVIAFCMSVIKVSIDGGETWNSYDPDSAFGSYYGVTVSRDGRAIVAAHHGGKIWITLDGGSTWSSGGSASKKWNSVTITDDLQTLYAVASDVTSGPDHIYKSTNGGSTWSQISSTADHYFGVDCSSDGTYVLVGRNSNSSNNGVLLVSTNSGSGFTERNTSISGSTVDLNYRNVAVCSDGSRMVASVYGGNFPAKVYYTSDYGTTWEAASTPVNFWWDCDITKDGYKIVASTYQFAAYFNAISHDYSDDIILDNSSQYLSTKNIGAKNILSENILAGQIISNGNVGIGTASPDGKLHIKSEIVDQYHLVLEDDSTSNIFQIGVGDTAGVISVDPTNTNASSNLQFHVDGSSKALFGTSTNFFYQPVSISASNNSVLVGNTSTVFNEDGNDIDFRVEGLTDDNLLFTDASTDRVGIGTATPNADTKMEVNYDPTDGPYGIMVTKDGQETTDGVVLGDCLGTTYQGLSHVTQDPASFEYMIVSQGEHTFISANSGYDAIIRAGANSTNYQLCVKPDSAEFGSTGDLFKLNSAGAIFNDGGANLDFRVEGDTLTHLIHADASKDEVVIHNAIGYPINYATSEGWVEATGGTSSQVGYYGGDFISNGASAKNYINYSDLPNGLRGLVWQSRNNTSDSTADGGWRKEIYGLDPAKTYISVVYVRRVSSDANSTVGSFYHGARENTTYNLDNTVNSNPYFHVFLANVLPYNVWCVSIGVIHANGDPVSSSTGIGGVYRLDTGARINGTTTDYRMGPNVTSQNLRTLLYYDSVGTTELDWCWPGFYEINSSAAVNLLNTILYDHFSGRNITVNEDGGNFDFRVEGDTDQNLLFTDAGTDKVGIGTALPQMKLDVNGTFRASDVVTLGSGSIPLSRKPIELLNPTNISELTINEQFTFPTTDGSAGQSLVTDGAGNVAWSGVSGGSTSLGTLSVTSSQSLFNMTDSYSSGGLAVFLNGVKLVKGTDFSETSNTSFTLTSPAASGDIVEYVAYGSTIASTNLQKTGDTMTGNLTVNADLLIGSGNSLTIGQGGSDSFTLPDADGSANQIIETDGSGNLSWVNKPQVVTNVYTSKTTYSVAAAGSTGTYIAVLNTSITPTKSSSRIRVELNISFEASQHDNIFRLFRSVNGGADTEVIRNDDANYWSGWAIPGYDADNASTPRTNHHIYIDSPNTTLPVTYKFMIQSAGAAASTFCLNRSVNSVGTASYENAISQVILTEIPQ